MFCYNYDSGEYEDFAEDGYSWTRGEYVLCWDESPYEEERLREEEEEEEEERRRKEKRR